MKNLQERGLSFIDIGNPNYLDTNDPEQMDYLLELIMEGRQMLLPVLLTPEAAQTLIQLNIDNVRPWSRKRSKDMALDMANGKWESWNAHMGFSIDSMANGQHMTNGCIISGVPIKVWVQTGMTEAQIMVQDNGAPRMGYHSIPGMTKSTQATLKAMLKMEFGIDAASTHALLSHWGKFAPEITALSRMREDLKGKPNGAYFHAALLRAMANGVSTTDIKMFLIEIFGNTTWLQASKFRNNLTASYYRGQNAQDVKRRYNLTLMVLNNYLNDEDSDLPSTIEVDRYDPLEHWGARE